MPLKPLPYRIRITNTQTGQKEVLSGCIPADDWQRMDAFRTEAVNLKGADWNRAGLDTRYEVRPEAGRTVIAWPGRPSDSQVADLLHRLRPFVLQSEELYFPKVTGRMWRYFTHPAIRDELELHRSGFEDGYGRAYYQVSIAPTLEDALSHGGLILNDAHTFHLWVNAFEYHRDTAKREELLSALGGQLDDLTRTTFIHMAADKARAILHVARFLDQLASSATDQATGTDQDDGVAL